MWYWSLALWSAALIVPSPTRFHHQQRTADRLLADSLLSELPQTANARDLPTDRCRTRPSKVSRMCDGLIALRRSELLGTADAVRAADRAAQRAVAEMPASAITWYTLGIARLQLVGIHALAKEGPLQPVGVSNEAAAGYALAHALELDPTLQIAAEALALAALPPVREGASRLHERLVMLRRVRDILSPEALYGAGRVETIAGDPDSAVVDFRMALDHAAAAPGLVDIALARAEYKGGHATEGRDAFLAGTGDTAERSMKAYREHVAWVASPVELAAWDSLPAAQRPEWLAHFWARRDVASGKGDGSRLVEHFARYEVALKLYPVIIPYTGIQRNAQDAEVFGDVREAIRAAAHSGDTASSLLISRLLQFDGDSRMFGTASPFRFVRLTQDILDDRGVVYMRHGKPDQIASGHATTPVAPRWNDVRQPTPEVGMEIWRYNLAGGPLTLQFKQQDFSGTLEASVLVPSLVTGNAETRSQICYLDPSICPRAESLLAEIGSGNMNTARIKAAYDVGSEQIHRATTTDNDAIKFTAAVHPSIELHALRHADGKQRIVISYAIPGAELRASRTAAGVLYPLTLHVTAADSAGRRFDIDSTRTIVAETQLAKGSYLTGAIDISVPAGTYDVSLVMTQPDGRGAIATTDHVHVAAPSSALTVGELVLGNSTSGARWNSGAAPVPLNPLNTFASGGSAEAYFQVTGLLAGTAYTTTFDVLGASDAPGRPPRISVATTQQASTDHVELYRTLSLKELPPGRYRVQLSVSSGDVVRSSLAWLTIVK